MSFLFGSAPSVKTTTSPTINPTQENILNALAGFMQSGAPAPGVQPYQGTFSAPLSGLQNMSLAGLEHFASNVIPNMPQLDPTQAFQALSKGLNYGGPGQVSAPTVQAQQIDPSQVIQQSVVDPLTKAFNDRILPAITGKYGASAGGGFSSDAMEARRQAGSDLESNIATEAGQLGFSAASANQGANLSAATTTAADALTAGGLNIGANEFGQSAILQALGLAPATSAIPGAEASTTESLLGGTLAAGAVPQQQQQTQVAGQVNDFYSQIQQTLQRMGLAINATGIPTQQTNSIVNPGQTGLIPSLLGNLASNQGLGQALGPSLASAGSSLLSFLSDERVKDDVKKVGSLDSGVGIYRFRYKGRPETHVGFVAQDVEKKLPHAVGTLRSGVKTVDYGAVIADLLEAA